MQTRNLKYNAHGTVDMEIEHPKYGWIPFTASPDDSEPHGRELYAAAIAGDLGAIAAYVAPIPTSEQIAAEAERIATLNAIADAKADAAIQYLITHTPAECAAYVQNNVTNLATAVNFLSKVAMVLSVIAKDKLK